MKYIILMIILVILVLLWILYILRRNWAIRKVNCDTEDEKLFMVNQALDPFGFTFHVKHDIVVSKNDSWQREVGFCDFYDKKAPFLNIITEAEPIFFEYDHKEYRLEFWKGQYGITTGAEIGLYIRDYHSKLPEDFYRAARDDERLPMEFLLFQNCFLFDLKGYSWWLAGFDVGKFAKPKDLRLQASILFPNQEMQIAFVEGLLNRGYPEKKIHVHQKYVSFEFCCSKNYSLNCSHKFKRIIAQIFNRINCILFMHFTRDFSRTLDKITFIRYMFPWLYHYVIKLCVPKNKYYKYYKKKKNKNNSF